MITVADEFWTKLDSLTIDQIAAANKAAADGKADRDRAAAIQADITPSPLAIGLAQLVHESKRLFGSPLDWEQIGCYLDPSRKAEALDMLDDMEARLGFDVLYARFALGSKP